MNYNINAFSNNLFNMMANKVYICIEINNICIDTLFI